MQTPTKAVQLRIFIGEGARHGGHALYEAIVLKARDERLAGATVLRGPMGFGHSHKIHADKLIDLGVDLPVVVEIVDDKEKIDAFLPTLDAMMTKGFIVMSDVLTLRYG